MFIPPVEPGRYLGTTNKAGVAWLPYDDDAYVAWKRLVGAVGVAEWGWTPKFPAKPYLKDLWFKPYMMCVKEVTW